MATATDILRLRADIGATEVSLTDEDAQAIFEEAAEKFTDTQVITAYTRVIALRRIMASSARMVSYSQNESSVDASDIFNHLQRLLSLWQQELSHAQTVGSIGGSWWATITPTW